VGGGVGGAGSVGDSGIFVAPDGAGFLRAAAARVVKLAGFERAGADEFGNSGGFDVGVGGMAAGVVTVDQPVCHPVGGGAKVLKLAASADGAGPSPGRESGGGAERPGSGQGFAACGQEESVPLVAG